MERPWFKFYADHVPHDIDVPDKTLYDLLIDSAGQNPELAAVVQNGREVTYRELKEAAEKLAAHLYSDGFRKQDMLAVMLPNCLEYIIAFFAVQRIGGIIVQVNPMYQPRELEHVLQDSGASRLLTQRAQLPKIDAIPQGNELKLILIDGERGDPSSLADCLATAAPEPPYPDIDLEEDIAILQYTGGTTGRSKGVMVTHSNVVSNLYQNMVSGPVEEDSGVWGRIIGIAPMFHAMGMTTMITTIFRGGTYRPMARFELNEAVKAIQEFRPTIFSGSPTMYIALLNHPDLKPEDLESIQSFSSGSAPLSMEVMRMFEQKTAVPIIEAYGLSEGTTMTHKNPSEQRKVGSIGIPVPGTDCRIVDIENGTEDVPIGETGELLIKGPQVMKGYWKNEEETNKALRDGWLYTGDLAVMDEDGYFYIVGRKKDMIIASGYNIYPLEIEEVLYKMPQVKEVCVYGIPDTYRGETVKAAIVLKDGAELSSEEVEEFCNTQLARFKVPRQIEFVKELPKTAVGKILRTKLIEMEKEKRAHL